MMMISIESMPLGQAKLAPTHCPNMHGDHWCTETEFMLATQLKLKRLEKCETAALTDDTSGHLRPQGTKALTLDCFLSLADAWKRSSCLQPS